MLNPPINGKIQGLFKAFVSLSLSHCYPGSGVVLDCIDSWSLHPYFEFFKDFYGKFNFQGTFQDSPVYSSTSQACANPGGSVNWFCFIFFFFCHLFSLLPLNFEQTVWHLLVFHLFFFKMLIFKNNPQMTKSMQIYPAKQRINLEDLSSMGLYTEYGFAILSVVSLSSGSPFHSN